MGGRVLLVAGGTGGHIMPAIAFGRWTERNRPDAEVAYVCGTRALELEIYGSAGISPYTLALEGSPMSGGVPLKEKARRAISTVGALAKAKKILREYRPDCCVLFGGYVSLPFLFICKVTGVPFVVHEQNACAGMVTRLAAKLGAPVLTGWEVCVPLADSCFERVGVPVREFRKMGRSEAMMDLGIPEYLTNRCIAVIFSGSLGSVSIKQKISEISSSPAFKDWLFLIPAMSGKIERIAENVWLLPKIWDPSPLFAVADLIVSRAGGSTLTEAAVSGLPVLVIPWKRAARDHQSHNAKAFLSENTGIILDLETEFGLLATKLSELKKLKDDGERRGVSASHDKAWKINEKLWGIVASQF